LGNDTLSYPVPRILSSSLRKSELTAGQSDYTGLYSSGDVVFMTVEHVGDASTASLISVSYSSTVTNLTYACSNVILYPNSPSAGLTSLSCLTAAGVGSGYQFVVTALNQASDPGTDTYNYVVPPVITRVQGCTDVGMATMDCPTSGGSILTLTGTAFGSADDSLAVLVGSVDCTGIVFTGGNNLTCTLQAGAGANMPVTLYRGQLFSAAVNLVSFAPAKITAVSGCTDVGSSTALCPRAGNTVRPHACGQCQMDACSPAHLLTFPRLCLFPLCVVFVLRCVS